MNISIFRRITTAYLTIGKSFGIWLSPIITGFLLLILRIIVFLFMKIDYILFPKLFFTKIKKPIIIVGNPRSGTTFLHRYLSSNNLGTGSQLWKLLYPSLTLQKIIYPFLPLLEKISPTKHHSTVAHKTNLQSIETDDASILFRFFDGFFLYGFILCWHDDDLFDWVDPKVRNNSKRDFKWLKAIWKRTLIGEKQDTIIPKLFSVSANIPDFLNEFPDAKILYMVRDPLSVIPSGLSLVTGVLDKRFGFWNQPEKKRNQYLSKLYKGLVQLQTRFHDDWVSGKIDTSKVMIVKFDDLMNNFDGLMKNILEFVDYQADDSLLAKIKETAESQKNFKSKHKYDLEKFGLLEKQIQQDCNKIYRTFLNNNSKK